MTKDIRKHLSFCVFAFLIVFAGCGERAKKDALAEFATAVQSGDSLAATELVKASPFRFRQEFYGLAENALKLRYTGQEDSARFFWQQSGQIAHIFDSQFGDRFMNNYYTYLHSLRGDSLRTKIRADSLYRLAQSRLGSGDYETAEQLYAESAARCRQIGDERTLLDNQLKLQYFHYYHGRQAEALRLAGEVIARSRAIGYRYREGWGSFQMATTLFDLGRYREAIPYLETALVIGKEQEDRRAIRSTLERLGVAELRLGNYPRAVQIYQESMALSREENDLQNVIRLHNGLAMVQRLMGNFDQAKEHYLQALEIANELDDENIATVEENLGNFYRILGDFQTAEEYIRRALERHREVGNPLLIAQNLTTLGDVRRDQNNDPAALALYRDALNLLGNRPEDAKAQRMEADLWISLGTTHLRAGQTDSALQALSSAKIITDRIGFREGFTLALIQLGRAYRASGVTDRAEQLLRQAIEAAEELHDPLLSFQGHYELGVLFQPNQPARAMGALEKAVDIIDTTRVRLEDNDRVHYFATTAIQDCYDRLILLALEQDAPGRALWYTERSRARGLLDVFRESDHHQQADKTLLSAKAIQARLPGDVQVLEFKITPEHLLIFGYDQRRLRVEQVAIRHDVLDALVQRYRDVIGAGDFNGFNRRVAENSRAVFEESAKLAAQLYAILIRPLEKHIDQERTLYIIPDGILHYLPFAALMPQKSGSEFLISRFRLAFAPSANVLIHLIEKERNSGSEARRLFAVGDPALNLPNAREEVRSIARMFSSADTLIGLEASEESVLAGLAEGRHYDVLHFATHAIINEQKPRYSYLVLGVEAATQQNTLAVRSGSAGTVKDGSLLPDEIAALDFHDTELVSLSACKTATGRIFRGEGVVGLTRAFMQAGAPALITTLWDINDAYTRRLMESFYRHWLLDKLPRAEALRQAQLNILQEMKNDAELKYPHPNRWAAFTLTGDYR